MSTAHFSSVPVVTWEQPWTKGARSIRRSVAGGRLPLTTARGEPDEERQQRAAEKLLDTIRSAHRQAREQGIEYPEVDIVAIWRQTIQGLRAEGLVDTRLPSVDLQRLAVEYEVRTNQPGPCQERWSACRHSPHAPSDWGL